MAWWRRLLPAGKKNSTLELFREIYGGRTSKAGQSVNLKTALQVATVFACVRVIADGIAQVPLKLFRESPDGKSRQPAKEHPLYWILFRRPNPWQTSFQYRETVAMHAVLAGNHFSFINRVRGNVVELIPFEPSQVCVKRDPATYKNIYEVTAADGSSKETFPQDVILHVRGPSWNSWMGLECVQLAREAIGLSMAIEEQQASFFRNGAQTTGLLSIEGNLIEEQYKKLRKWLDDEHVSSRNAGRPMIMDHGAKWLQMVMSSVDAQTLEQRRYQVEEVCRSFRVMPIMVGNSDKATTYASAEQMFLAHVVHTLSPWYERLEQDFNAFLLTDADAKAGLYVKFIEEGLLRGALRDTSEYLRNLTGAGIMTRNEARAKLDMNPLDGLDDPLTPVNMVAGEPPTAADSATVAADTVKQTETYD